MYLVSSRVCMVVRSCRRSEGGRKGRGGLNPKGLSCHVVEEVLKVVVERLDVDIERSKKDRCRMSVA
jgi:hypothetical protein